MLPLDCIRHIMTFSCFLDRVQLVSHEWLSDALHAYRQFQPTEWRQKLLLYSCHCILDSNDYWHFFCQHLIRRNKRKRDELDQLTWKATAKAHMLERRCCRACGCPTTATVFGFRLCLQCRQNPLLKHTFMLKVYQVLAGRWATRAQLATVPYHGSCMNGHWRFWTGIVEAVPGLEDSAELRRQF
jgi:hypothetical protein